MDVSEYNRGYRHGAKIAHEAHCAEVADLRTRLAEAEKTIENFDEVHQESYLTIRKLEAENASLKQTIEKVRKHCEFVSSDKRYFDSDRSFAHYILKILDGEK